ncbi:MAG: STAS domain-containing protein [Acidimicrobiales bacterium]
MLRLRPGTVVGALTAAEPQSLLAGIGSPSLGLTEWTMGSSVVVSVTGEVDIATTDQLSEALGTALRSGPKGLICDLSAP